MRRAGWLTMAVACAALLPGFTANLHAQIAVFPRQNLSFGVLTPAVPKLVEVTDVADRAELEIVGTRGIVFETLVPSHLVSAGGHTLPLAFLNGHGRIQAKVGPSANFQPGTTVSFHIPPGAGGAWVWIGGTASPSASQRPGVYTGTITVRIISAGT
jgi:hypothetical protein